VHFARKNRIPNVVDTVLGMLSNGIALNPGSAYWLLVVAAKKVGFFKELTWKLLEEL